MSAPRLLFSVLLVLLAGSCATPDSDEPEPALPTYPPEFTVEDFPGISYPQAKDALPHPGRPVWLVGIDGASWDLLKPMVDRGELPGFASLIERGAHGELLSERPTISPALWATIATGMPRFEHGVVNFLVKRPGRPDTVQAGPLDRRSPAIWELVQAAGGRSAVVGWFGSYPAEEIEGYYVSKGFDPEQPRGRQVHPPDFAETLRGIESRIARDDLEAIARSDFLSETLHEDARALGVLRSIVGHDADLDFVAVYFAGIDVAQHVLWRHMDPSSQEFSQDGEPDPTLADVIPAYYRFIDRCLQEILALAPENASVVVVSDHGAGPMQPAEAYHFQLEVLLELLGLAGEPDSPALAIGEMYRNEKRIWLNVEGVERDGTVSREEAPAEAARIAERLRALRTDSDSAVFADVVDHTLDTGWLPGQAALTVRFAPEALVAAQVVDDARRIGFDAVRMRHTDVSGSHRDEGILILAGTGVQTGRLPQAANLYHIAPTVLHLLGLPQDRRMLRYAPAGGGVLEIALDPADLTQRPPVMIPEYPDTERTALLRDRRTEPIDDPVNDEAMERLRSLGYVR